MSFPDEETLNLIHWWEQELTGEDRHYLLDGYIWKGSIEERRKKLREMRSKWDSLGCPHCGSKTKHKSWCTDQQIINAFKDLKDE